MKIEISQKFESEELAARIADGESVDWDELGAVTPQSDIQELERLRSIEKMIRTVRHRHASVTNTTERATLFRFGGLDVIERIGAGAQGEVYRAYDPMLDQHVALKPQGGLKYPDKSVFWTGQTSGSSPPTEYSKRIWCCGA